MGEPKESPALKCRGEGSLLNGRAAGWGGLDPSLTPHTAVNSRWVRKMVNSLGQLDQW